MKYLLYGMQGGIEKTKERIKNKDGCFNSLTEAIDGLLEEREEIFTIEDLAIKRYGFDSRINKTVYLITTKRFQNQHFDVPQFASFMVEIDD